MLGSTASEEQVRAAAKQGGSVSAYASRDTHGSLQGNEVQNPKVSADDLQQIRGISELCNSDTGRNADRNAELVGISPISNVVGDTTRQHRRASYGSAHAADRCRLPSRALGQCAQLSAHDCRMLCMHCKPRTLYRSSAERMAHARRVPSTASLHVAGKRYTCSHCVTVVLGRGTSRYCVQHSGPHGLHSPVREKQS